MTSLASPITAAAMSGKPVSNRVSPFKLTQAPNLLRNQHLQHFNMMKVINVRVKKDINELLENAGNDEDLLELERQMQLFDQGEKGQ
jgi:hypothetical protein